MSHQRYPSSDAVKEPHSVSLKVLRLSRPSLVAQYPVQPPSSGASPAVVGLLHQPPLPASLAYPPAESHGAGHSAQPNPVPFILSPMLNLPPSFGSTYVGETFSCTLCANHDVMSQGDVAAPGAGGPGGGVSLRPLAAAAAAVTAAAAKKTIRDVRIEAEMKTPNSAAVTKLELLTSPDQAPVASSDLATAGGVGVDLEPGETLQKVVNFDLKEEGNHVLAVTVSYYEATDTSGRTRTFRKLYQFICKASLIVRTKPGPLPAVRVVDDGGLSSGGWWRRRWVLEAQLENCSEDTMQLERIVLDLEPGLAYTDCNWEASASPKPVLHPGETEQVCFVLEEETDAAGAGRGGDAVLQEQDGRIIFGVLGISWRSEMGNRGFLETGKLGTRHVKPREPKAITAPA